MANASHDHITAQHIRFQMNSVDSLNGHIADVHRQKNEIKKSADICSSYLVPGFNMTFTNRKRAQKYFDEFRVQTKNLNSYLEKLDGKVADLGDYVKQVQYKRRIRDMKAKLATLGTVSSLFIGMLMSKNYAWNEDMVQKLNDLVIEISKDIDDIQLEESGSEQLNT